MFKWGAEEVYECGAVEPEEVSILGCPKCGSVLVVLKHEGANYDGTPGINLKEHRWGIFECRECDCEWDVTFNYSLNNVSVEDYRTD